MLSRLVGRRRLREDPRSQRGKQARALLSSRLLSRQERLGRREPMFCQYQQLPKDEGVYICVQHSQKQLSNNSNLFQISQGVPSFHHIRLQVLL